MGGRSLAAIALAAMLAVPVQASEPELRPERKLEPGAHEERIHPEHAGIRGNFRGTVERLSDSRVRARVLLSVVTETTFDATVYVYCFTADTEYVCAEQTPLTVRGGTELVRSCRTVRVRSRSGELRKRRRCRSETRPRRSSAALAVEGLKDGQPVRVAEMVVLVVRNSDHQRIATTGRLGVPD